MVASLSYRVATRRHCLILLKNRSIKLRARYRYGLKQMGSLRFRFGGMLAHAPCWRASSLIQSASYPRSAGNVVCGGNAPRRCPFIGAKRKSSALCEYFAFGPETDMDATRRQAAISKVRRFSEQQRSRI